MLANKFATTSKSDMEESFLDSAVLWAAFRGLVLFSTLTYGGTVHALRGEFAFLHQRLDGIQTQLNRYMELCSVHSEVSILAQLGRQLALIPGMLREQGLISPLDLLTFHDLILNVRDKTRSEMGQDFRPGLPSDWRMLLTKSTSGMARNYSCPQSVKEEHLILLTSHPTLG